MKENGEYAGSHGIKFFILFKLNDVFFWSKF